MNAVRQIAGDRINGNSAFNCVAVGGDPRTIGFEIVHFGLHRDEVSTVGRGVLLTPLDSGQRELLGSPLGLSGINGRLGRGCIGSVLLLALVLGELPVFDEEKETRTAGVGLFVGPLVHAKFALRFKYATSSIYFQAKRSFIFYVSRSIRKVYDNVCNIISNR